MSALRLLQLSILELWRSKRITSFLIFNFTLGLVGFFWLQVFQQSLTSQTTEKAQAVLGGDLSISARRTFKPEEVSAWEKSIPIESKSRGYALFSMLRTKADSRLVNINVFDSQYPLYGQFKIEGRPLKDGYGSDEPFIWLDPEVKDLFNVNVGDSVELGETNFIVAGLIIEDPTRLFRGTGFAPRAMFHEKHLQKAQLIKPGSTLTEYWLYKINPKTDPIEVRKNLELNIKDTVVRVESYVESGDDSNRVLQYFTDYLGLVALVALGLCFLCGRYLLQWTFQSKKKNIAIFKTLGLSDQKILILYFLQSFFVALISSVLSLIIVAALLPSLQTLLVQRFNLPLVLQLNAESMTATFLIGIFGPLVITIPQVLQIFELQALDLFRNSQESGRRNVYYYFWLLTSLILFWGLAAWQSHSFKLASGFVAALVVLFFSLSFLNRGLLALLERVTKNSQWVLRHACRGLSRRPQSTQLVFVTMSLATLVLSLLPHIKSSILFEVRPENSTQLPQLFLFDIQPDQVASLQTLSAQYFDKSLKLSPLVRSRILKVNDQAYERVIKSDGFKTREEENEARFRNRGVNLTYSDGLQDSERLIKGNFSGSAKADGALPGLSIEERFAERINVDVGDVMTFDVQGVEVKGQITSLRQVRWTSFQPNFFILFPNQVLEEAPQIFLTSVTSPDLQKVKVFQNEVAQKFKNISVIDVSRIVKNSLVYIEQMSVGLQLMAWLAVSVGLFVFIILLNTQIRERLQELNLMQIMGATPKTIRNVVFLQFFIIIIMSVLNGVLLGLVGAWVIMESFFNIKTIFDLPYLYYLGFIIVPLSVGLIFIGIRPLKKLNPMDLIRQVV